MAEATARPVIEKYTGVPGAVDVFTTATAFTILESIASTSATAWTSIREPATVTRKHLN